MVDIVGFTIRNYPDIDSDIVLNAKEFKMYYVGQI